MEKKENWLTADDARKLVEKKKESDNELYYNAVETILKSIESAASEGGNSIQVGARYPNRVYDTLRELGFKVSDLLFGTYGGNYRTICW